ncbi:MAG: glutaredoxin domain-containing protein [Candidatus Paceibacterota bacterium]
MAIRLFTTPTCSYCVTLKKFLQEHDVQFEVIDVLADKEAQEEMVQKTNQMTVPVLDINGEFIVGFDRRRIVESLGLKDED